MQIRKFSGSLKSFGRKVEWNKSHRHLGEDNGLSFLRAWEMLGNILDLYEEGKKSAGQQYCSGCGALDVIWPREYVFLRRFQQLRMYLAWFGCSAHHLPSLCGVYLTTAGPVWSRLHAFVIILLRIRRCFSPKMVSHFICTTFKEQMVSVSLQGKGNDFITDGVNPHTQRLWFEYKTSLRGSWILHSFWEALGSVGSGD